MIDGVNCETLYFHLLLAHVELLNDIWKIYLCISIVSINVLWPNVTGAIDPLM